MSATMAAATEHYRGTQEADLLASAGVRSNVRSFSPTHTIRLSASYPTGNAGTAHAPTCIAVSKTHQARCCYLGNGYHKSLEREWGERYRTMQAWGRRKWSHQKRSNWDLRPETLWYQQLLVLGDWVLDFFFFLKLNTTLWWTERLWLFDFLPAWETVPACRVCALTFAEGQAAGQTPYSTRASQDFGPRLIFHTAGPEQGPQGPVAWSCLGFFCGVP